MKIKQEAESEEGKLGKFFDSSLRGANRKKDKRLVAAFQFVSKGAIIEKGEQLRTEINLRKRAPEIKGKSFADDYKQLSRSLRQTGVRRTGARVRHHVIHIYLEPNKRVGMVG